MVARTLGVREVAGSNPVVPNTKKAFRVKTESLLLNDLPDATS